ncbi:hypothetical protein LTS18_000973, partial [Coniosporium uncinatum]
MDEDSFVLDEDDGEEDQAADRPTKRRKVVRFEDDSIRAGGGVIYGTSRECSEANDMEEEDDSDALSSSSGESSEDLSSESSEAESSDESSPDDSSDEEDSDSEPEKVPFSMRGKADAAKSGMSPNGATPPYQGTSDTRNNNKRKRDIKKMRALKAQGLLEPNASLADYR